MEASSAQLRIGPELSQPCRVFDYLVLLISRFICRLACELTQLDLLPIAPRPPPGPRGAERPSEAAEWHRMLAEAPAVGEWLKGFALSCGPAWGEAHTMLYKLQARLHGTATGPAVTLA